MTNSLIYTLYNKKKNINTKTLFLIYNKKNHTPINLNYKIKKNTFNYKIKKTQTITFHI